MADPTDPATLGVGGIILAALGGAWRYFRPQSVDREARRIALKAAADVEKVEGRLAGIEITLSDVTIQGRRNETGIAEVRTQLNSMQTQASAAATQIASALGEIKGELRAKRDMRRGGDPE